MPHAGECALCACVCGACAHDRRDWPSEAWGPNCAYVYIMVIRRVLLLGPVVKKMINKWRFSSQNGHISPRGPPCLGRGAQGVQSKGSGQVGGQEGEMLEH